MKVTNKKNLPQALVRVIEESLSEPHNKPGEYSITTLMSGICEVQLTSRHFDEIEVDASREIWAIFGTAIHALLERSSRIEDGVVAERSIRLPMPANYADTGISAGAITAKCDIVNLDSDEPVVEDYKTTKATALMYPDTEAKWKQQLKGYCAMLQFVEGIPVRRVKIHALLKDWSEGEAKKNVNYPDAPAQVFDWKFTQEEIEEAWTELLARYVENKRNETVDDNQLPTCSKEERWAKDDAWAIVKAGATKAAKVIRTSRTDALEILQRDYGPAYGLEERRGEDTKCIYFCKAKEFCPYYKKNYLFTMKND